MGGWIGGNVLAEGGPLEAKKSGDGRHFQPLTGGNFPKLHLDLTPNY